MVNQSVFIKILERKNLGKSCWDLAHLLCQISFYIEAILREIGKMISI